jgi:hypothetical protein
MIDNDDLFGAANGDNDNDDLFGDVPLDNDNDVDDVNAAAAAVLREQHKHSGRNARRDSCGNNYDVATPSAPAHLLLLLLLLPYHIQLTSSAIVPVQQRASMTSSTLLMAWV